MDDHSKVGLLNLISISLLRNNISIHLFIFDFHWQINKKKFYLCLPLQIPETEGASLAASHSVGFCEVSVADNSPNLYKVFEKLLVESRARPVKPRKFSVSKMIGEFA